jgi:hypothetical protein
MNSAWLGSLTHFNFFGQEMVKVEKYFSMMLLYRGTLSRISKKNLNLNLVTDLDQIGL